MICPKCGFEQPDTPECIRCGVIVSRYKGPVLGTTQRPAPPPPASPPSFAPGNEPVRLSVPPPPAPVEAAGTLYGGPAPALAVAGGGTVYDGPLPEPGGGGGTAFGDAVPAARQGRVPTVSRGTFETGRILRETFSIYFSNFLPFLILTTLAMSPFLLLSAWMSTQPAASMLQVPVTLLKNWLCTPLAAASITYGVYQQIRGGSPSLGACLRVGLVALLPMIGLAIVQGLAVGCGLILFIIPGLMLAVRWSVAVPAAIEEKTGVGDSLTRSSDLTEGYRWQIFFALAVIYALGFVAGLAAGFLSLGNSDQAGFLDLATSALEVLFTGIAATATAVMYYRLRSVKESIDVDQIASVFA